MIVTILSLVCFALLCLSFYLWKRPRPLEIRYKTEAIDSASNMIEQLLKGRAVVVVDVMDYNEIYRWSPKSGQVE